MCQREKLRAVLLRDLGIVPLPADRNYFPITDSTSQNSPPPPLMLVAVTSQFWQQKRLADLFWIAELTIYSQADIHFVVFGDGHERESLLRQRDERLLARRIHFVGHHDDVADWLPVFDMILMPNVAEGRDAQTRQREIGVAVLQLYEEDAALRAPLGAVPASGKMNEHWEW